MEPDIYTLGGSLRRNSSSMWRNNGIEAFSRSSREEDDEEALRWAALEKLPTYNRLRKGLLFTASRGAANEVDIEDLDLQEKRNLVERLVKIADEDNEKFLLKLKNRIDRFISIPIWWRWYYWGCPVAWTLYGLVASQFADFKDPIDEGRTIPRSVEQYLEAYYGFKHDYIGFCAIVVAGLAVIFACIFAYSIKAFNFQRR
ncbi:hypothetical protein RJ641_020056 [Dillenia turbinata]|uniref:Uncharacterized protein n=1 Tax=Dillenia turbinata TaxID=194707 RepID=A0AAN8YTS4_9MAGN